MQNRLIIKIALIGLLAAVACQKNPEKNEVDKKTHQEQVNGEAKQKTQKKNQNEKANNNAVSITQTKYISRAKKPKWVKQVKVPEFPESRMASVQNGIAYILSDTAIKMNESGYDRYYRLVSKVVERVGLEDISEISISFDPKNQKLSLISVRVTRNGKATERLEDVQIRELQRETDLSKGVVGGEITALIHIPDVRTGDIVEYSFVKNVRTPLWEGEYFSVVDVGWGVPLAKFRYQISVTNKKTLQIKPVNIDISPKVEKTAEETVYMFELDDPDVEKQESDLPIERIGNRVILLGTYDKWSDLAKWGAKIYDLEKSLSDEFKTKLNNIHKKFSDKDEIIVETLRLVQNDIRYLAIAIGDGGYVPRTPKQTLQNGYGDCKDKTVLLIAALNYLGIDADPALVNSKFGHTINNLLPAPNIFDHVIVRVKTGEKTFWLDPTLTHQGGRLDSISVPDYGYALPLINGQTELEKIIKPEPLKPTKITHDIITIPEKGDIGFKLEVTTNYFLSNADSMRRKIANNGKKKLYDDYMDYYKKLYPRLEKIGQLQIVDDLDNNTLTTKEYYKMSRSDFEAEKLDEKFFVKADSIRNLIPENFDKGRQTPIGLKGKINLRHIISIKTPGKTLGVPDNTNINKHGISFNQVYEDFGEEIKIVYDLKVKRVNIDAKYKNDIEKIAKQIEDATYLSIKLPKASKTLQSRLKIDKPVPENIKKQISEISKLENDDKNKQALAGLNKLANEYKTKDALRGYILLYRADVMNNLGRGMAAFNYYREGFELYEPDWMSAYFNYIGLLRQKEKYNEAAEIIIKLLHNHPASIKNMNMKWFSRYAYDFKISSNTKNYNKLMIAMAESLDKNKNEEGVGPQDWIFKNAVTALVEEGDIGRAAPLLKHIRSPRQLGILMMSLNMQPLWTEIEKLAGDDLSKRTKANIIYYKKRAFAKEAGFEEKREYLQALQLAGEYKTAISYAEPIIEDWDSIEAEGEDAYWFVNRYAYILLASGKAKNADEVLERLVNIGLRENGALVSMAINRADMLASIGEFDKSIDVANEILEVENEDDDRNIMSDTGKLYLYNSMVCSYYGRGEKRRANDFYREKMKPLLIKTPDRIPTDMLTLLCLEKYDAAEKLLIERLKTKKHRDDVILAFALTTENKKGPKYLMEIFSRLDKIKNRPKVQDIAKKYIRPIKIKGSRQDWGEY